MVQFAECMLNTNTLYISLINVIIWYYMFNVHQCTDKDCWRSFLYIYAPFQRFSDNINDCTMMTLTGIQRMFLSFNCKLFIHNSYIMYILILAWNLDWRHVYCLNLLQSIDFPRFPCTSILNNITFGNYMLHLTENIPKLSQSITFEPFFCLLESHLGNTSFLL